MVQNGSASTVQSFTSPKQPSIMPQSDNARSEQPRTPWTVMRRMLRLAGKPLEWLFIGLVRGYQTFISPLLPRTCRFYPSCSQYMIEALRKKGPIIGFLKGIWRVMRCNPWCEGGYDPVERHGEQDCDSHRHAPPDRSDHLPNNEECRPQ